MKLEIRSLTKYYYHHSIINDFSLTIKSGDIIGITGPNGSGKTTLLKMISGISSFDKGEILINNKKMHPDMVDNRKFVYYVGHVSGFYGRLTAKENLNFLYKIYGCTNFEIEDVLSKIGLDIDNKKLVKFFSQGMLQRLKLAAAELISPRILLLDEPRTSLDQKGLIYLDNLLDEWEKNKTTIIIVSHNKTWLSDTTKRIIKID
tara:strand:- start:202 stop:813 length:612 start_codon:yes stop_codon:yes gene_type:complete